MRANGVLIDAPEDLTPARWYAYVDARRATGISPHTLNGELTLLRGWLWWLTDDEQPICARMLKVRPLRAPARLPKDLPTERLRALQRVIERESQHPEPHLHRRGLMDLAWFLLMLHSGLRTGEIRRLLPDAIDWERRLIRIVDSKGLRSRMAPFSTQVADALNTWLAVRGESRELPACVFIDRSLPLSGSYCYSRLKLYGERCGVRAHPHQLRHSCATLLLNTGMPLPQVQALLGHQQIQTTRDYARSFDGVVAADYTRAMLSLERDLGLTPSGASTPTAAQIVALLDGLRTTGVLNPRQLDDPGLRRGRLWPKPGPACSACPRSRRRPNPCKLTSPPTRAGERQGRQGRCLFSCETVARPIQSWCLVSAAHFATRGQSTSATKSKSRAEEGKSLTSTPNTRRSPEYANSRTKGFSSCCCTTAASLRATFGLRVFSWIDPRHPAADIRTNSSGSVSSIERHSSDSS
jgi:integrase